MHLKRVQIRRFRGFDDLTFVPRAHVVVMGEPGAGRSDLIEALSRVLDAGASRTQLTTEVDFYKRDTAEPIRIAITIGDLGADLEQRFLDHLELWDRTQGEVLTESDAPDTIDQERYEWVLRLEHRAQWMADEERCDEWVHYPKDSDPDSNVFVHARRQDIEALGFGVLRLSGGRILDLGARSPFRQLIERAGGNDFSGALTQYVKEVTSAAGQFTSSAQVTKALSEIVEPLKDLLGIPSTDPSQLFQFAPEGGSASGLLRSLAPSIDLEDGVGSMPAWRRGSTTASLLRIAEALALLSGEHRILAVDDLGDGLDAGSAAHVALLIRRSAGQAWVTTRLPAVAEVFEPQEVARLGSAPDAQRIIRQGTQPMSKKEAVASKHWHRTLLPALTYRAVVVVEGPNDFAAIHALALRLSKEHGAALPATKGVSIISAGITGSGGYANVLKLAQAAREMGLRAVGVVDGDLSPEAQKYLRDYAGLADAVVRLPDKAAVEVAIASSLADAVLRQALSDVASAAGLAEPQGIGAAGVNLVREAVSFIKSNSLHSAFIDALPGDALPPMAIAILERSVEAASGSANGVIQL